MKTQVLMKRELFGCEITQQSKTEFFLQQNWLELVTNGENQTG